MRGNFLGVLNSKDHNMLGSFLGSLNLGNYILGLSMNKGLGFRI